MNTYQPYLPRRVDQALPSYAKRDAIGTETRLIRDLLRERGFVSQIFCENGDAIDDPDIRSIDEYAAYSHPRNVVIHHFSTGSAVPYHLIDTASFQTMRYHNITPSGFFTHPGDYPYFVATNKGLQQRLIVGAWSKTAWHASEYNRSQAQAAHYPEGVVLPVMRKYDALTSEPDSIQIQNFLKGPRRNILFVGRFAPNKAQHDMFFLLKLYKKYIDNNVRLILIGGDEGPYCRVRLLELARQLELKIADHPKRSEDFDADIVITGSVSDSEMATYYRLADVFLCLSDHEGFCVPLVEAMHLGTPIIAHRAAAIPETLADVGLLVDKNDITKTLASLSELLGSEALRNEIRQRGYQRARDFAWDQLVARFDKTLSYTLQKTG